MNMELMKRRLAALLCAALLTSGMPAGALAEGEAEAIQVETTGAQESGGEETYKKFKLKPETVEGVLCVSVSGASALDVLVRVLDAQGEVVAKQKVKDGTGTVFFNDVLPGVYTLTAAYVDEAAAAAVKAVKVEYEFIDEAAAQKAAEAAAAKKAEEEAAAAAAAKKAEEEAAAAAAAKKAEEEAAAAAAAAAAQPMLLEASAPVGGTAPADATTPADSTVPADGTASADATTPADSTAPADSTVPVDSVVPAGGTAPADGGSTGKNTKDVVSLLDATATVSGHTVTVVLKGNLGSVVTCGLFDAASENPYDDTKGYLENVSDTATVTFTDVPSGEYLFSAWYDVAGGAFKDVDVTVPADAPAPGEGEKEPVTPALSIGATVSGHTVTATFTGNQGKTISGGLYDPVSEAPYDSVAGVFSGIADTATMTFANVPAGTYVISAWYDSVEGVFADKEIIVEDKTETTPPAAKQFDVTASAGEDFVTVTVSGADARAVNVVLTRPDSTADTRAIEGGNGTLTWSGLAAGTYSVTAIYQDTVTGAVPVTKGGLVVAGKAPSASQFAASVAVDGDAITVTVTGASTQAVEVTLGEKDSLVSQSKTIKEGNGTASFEGLGKGTYTVTVDYAPHVDGVNAVTLSGIAVGTAEPAGQFVAAAATGKGVVNVTVSGALAQPIGVQLMKPDGTSEMKTIDAGNGTASFTGLAAGTYSIYADYMTPVSGVKAVEQEDIVVSEGADIVEIVPGQFEVDAAVSGDAITVTVTKANAQAVDVVLIRPDNTTDKRTLSAGNGTETFAKLDAGTYSVVVAYQAEVSGVSAVKREGLVVASGTTAGAIVATAKAGVGRVDVNVSAASKLPVAVTLLQGGVIRDNQRIEAGVGAVAFTGLAAGTYSVSIDYAPSQPGVKPYVIDGLEVTASIAPIAITKVEAGDNKLVVTGTAHPNTDVTLTTEPASSAVIVRADEKGAFRAEITCSAGSYTAVYAQYGADSATRVNFTGKFTVTSPVTAPTLEVDRVADTATTIIAKTTPGILVKLTTYDYTQTVTADSRGILRFYLPHTYGFGTKLTFTVYYGAGNAKSVNVEKSVEYEHYCILLKKGSNRWEVLMLTERLQELGYPIKPTYLYDSEVAAVVKLFQANNGLAVDGIAGRLTQEAARSVAAIGYSEATYPTLVRGDRGMALIYSLQQRLKDLGYYTIRVDGIFGSGTQRAVREFQANNGLTVTGRADDVTQKLLYSSAAKPAGTGASGSYTTLARSSRYSSQVVTLQRRLKALGYLAGAADGYFGSQTYRAVRSFQSRNGLSVTGIADPDTQKLLYSAAAKAASGTTVPEDTGYRLLYWGCRGDAVKKLQQALLDAGYKQVRVADGIYGQWTYDAVRAYQKDNGLAVDGIAGKNTQNKLYGTSY